MTQSTEAIPVSAIILTYNEQANIRSCIAGLAWCDEVIIVDSGSDDDTVNLARAMRSDVRVFENSFEDFGQQRNWALDNTHPRNQWVLFVDADELCTEEFFAEVGQFIEETDCVGGYIAGRNYFMGKWLKHSTMFPSYQLRLLRIGEVRYEKAGHGQREVVDGKLAYLKEGWRHESFSKGVAEWIARHNNYSTQEVILILKLRQEKMQWFDLFSPLPIKRRRALRRLSVRLPFTPVLMFVYTYLFRLGVLDGLPGLTYCSLVMAHQIHVIAKVREHEHAGRAVKSANG